MNTIIAGYVHLKKDLNCSFSMGDISTWENKIVRALEINKSSESLLVVDSTGTKMGMFNLNEALHVLPCKEIGGVIIPEGKSKVEELIYYSSRINRKGGYPSLVKNMVILRSLPKGRVDDRFLFQKD